MVKCDLEGFGKRLKEVRGKNATSQLELSTGTNIIPSYISRWENGKVYPSLELFAELCTALNCTPNDLLGVSTDLEPYNTFMHEWKNTSDIYTIAELSRDLPPESRRHIIDTIKRELVWNAHKKASNPL